MSYLYDSFNVLLPISSIDDSFPMYFLSAKSPVFTHITTTLDGLSTIRAFNAQTMLKNEFDSHQNTNTAIFHVSLGLSHGFGMSLDFMVYTFIGCVIYIFLLLDPGKPLDRSHHFIRRVIPILSIAVILSLPNRCNG